MNHELPASAAGGNVAPSRAQPLARPDPVARLKKGLHCLAHPHWRQALLGRRVAAAVEHADVLRSLGECRTVVDVGANRGQFALVARHCFPDARLVAFEPLPAAAGDFASLFCDDPRTTLHVKAIGHAAGVADMHVSARDDSSSLLEITDLQSHAFPGTQESHVAKVEVVRLSDVLPAGDIQAPALLKIDVQGFELNVLRGAEDVLPHFAHVYAECSFVEFYRGQPLAAELVAWLGARGWVLAGVFHMSYGRDGTALQGDFLFRRR